MRLPNGYGSITKLTGNRRKPWMVRVYAQESFDTKKNDYVRNRVVLGYYKTRKDALAALADYNDNPYNPADGNITFAEMYKKYLNTTAFKKLKESAAASRTTSFNHCRAIHDVTFRDLNKGMLQAVLDSVQQGSSTKKNILTLMRNLIDMAYDANIINKRYYEGIVIEYSDPVIDRIPFSQKEIDTLWSMSDKWDVKVLLILLYSGMRVNELLKNDRSNVNLEERWIYVPRHLAKNRESERYVPIHDKTFELVKWFYDKSIEHNQEKLMINKNGAVIPYNNFVARNLPRINQHMESPHRFHDTRHTFATKGTQAGIAELYMHRIMGHTPSSILYSTYTHITVQDLLPYINKIE